MTGVVCVYHGVKGPVYGANRASSACTAVCTPTRRGCSGYMYIVVGQ